MKEDLRENFILLSKIAKEKKYAQEYLGLLARRGDIGSIRIGKRWYTTWQWFEEFLENSQKKKCESIADVQIAEPVKLEEVESVQIKETIPSEYIAEKPAFANASAGEVKINIPFVFPEREKVFVSQSAENIQHEENISDEPTKIAVAVRTRREEPIVANDVPISKIEIKRVNPSAMPARNAVPGRIAIRTEKVNGSGLRKVERTQDIRVQSGNKFQGINRNQFLPKENNFGNTSVEERNKFAVPYQEIEIRNIAGVFSPAISADESGDVPLFPRFAFALSFAIILLLVAASGYFVYSGGLLNKGKVAGASDERDAGFSGIQLGSENVLTSASDKIVESVSVSRVVMEAAREKSINNSQTVSN